jgi:hypothetical protein
VARTDSSRPIGLARRRFGEVNAMTHAPSTRTLVLKIWTCGTHALLATVLSVVALEPVVAQEVPALVRIRSHGARITEAIAEGTERSGTFRRVVEEIHASDGLVYVDEGECGHAVRACLVLSVTVAGPNRVLHVRVNLRKAPGCELVEAIGHELQHAVELLGNPRVRNGIQAYRFFEIVGPTGFGRFETGDAIEVGLDVAHEACRGR